MKVKIRITNGGRIGGFTADIMREGEWHRVNKYIGGGVVSWDSREAALAALRREAQYEATRLRAVR